MQLNIRGSEQLYGYLFTFHTLRLVFVLNHEIFLRSRGNKNRSLVGEKTKGCEEFVMGEVVVSSEEMEELGMEEEGRRKEEEDGNGVKNGLTKWEHFFSRIVIRVLLVEADDSTRQIVSALLRKCSYKVAAVSDGLKAWEVLKGRPRNIDLILTEVDLPSISGYALLTLIMEHDICKNIPVIMMSSQDSVSTVYKCMLRGAADYLVKPIRKNELRNLWQHVWRRQSSLGGGANLLEGSLKQDKAEGTSENNAASNYASGDAAVPEYKDCIEKGSDALSSCTKPEMEGESVPVEDPTNVNDDVKMVDIHKSTTSRACTVSFPIMESSSDPNNTVQIQTEACQVYGRSSLQIDFMSSSKNGSSLGNENYHFQPSSHLELSLRGSHGTINEHQSRDDKFMLKHSSASAFTRYTNKPSLAIPNHTELRENSDAAMSTSGQVRFPSPNPDKSKDYEPSDCLQQSVTPIHNQKIMNFSKLCNNYGSLPPNGYHHHHHQTLDTNSSCIHRCHSCNTIDSTNQAFQKDQKIEGFEENGHISPTTDQSTNSSYCCTITRPSSIHYGSSVGSNKNQQVKNEEPKFGHNSSSHRSVQREAALLKFRMKRKDRCYEKKVRYESRKKLAEQRPRVKGQFVRQQEVDPSNVTN